MVGVFIKPFISLLDKVLLWVQSAAMRPGLYDIWSLLPGEMLLGGEMSGASRQACRPRF